jgi:hypothetical protein
VQGIGYDAAVKKIHSWMFDFSGGFSEAWWARDGKTWTVKSVATTRDGTNATATNILPPIDAETFTWESKDRMLDRW